MRGIMGIAGAMIMPSTLSILSATFTDKKERSQAIAIWAATFGLGSAGTALGGWLLENYSSSTVFFANVPLAIIAIIGGYFFISNSKEEHAPPIDLPGIVLSIIGMGPRPRPDPLPPCRYLDSSHGQEGQEIQPGALHSAAPASSSRWPPNPTGATARSTTRTALSSPKAGVLIDTAKSFVYAESGLKGVLMASRLSGLSPNLTSRFTPGTLISSYEVFEALRRGVAVPFRKRDAEDLRNISELRACDKGGMMFQPEPGVYEKVHQIDFTSPYPSIIVKFDLSPETIEHPELKGFVSTVLSGLLNLRIETKRLKKTNPDYAGIDSVLK